MVFQDNTKIKLLKNGNKKTSFFVIFRPFLVKIKKSRNLLFKEILSYNTIYENENLFSLW